MPAKANDLIPVLSGQFQNWMNELHLCNSDKFIWAGVFANWQTQVLIENVSSGRP